MTLYVAFVLAAVVTGAAAIFPLTGFGGCDQEVTEVRAGRAVHLSSENYPRPYPRGACQRRLLRPDSADTAVSLVCTDIDLDSVVLPWVHWRVWGDFLELPGRGMLYGRQWFQCDTAPLLLDAPPGDEVPLEFSANYLLQHRGFNCVARGLSKERRNSRRRAARLHRELTDCGRSRVKRILDGKDAKVGEFPFVVYIVTRTSDDKMLYCSASLISRRFVLTAAHCLESAVWTELRLGALDIGHPGAQSLVVNATKFKQHPEWSIASLERSHDIGLIELSEDVQFNDVIQPICLPAILELEQQYTDMEGTIAGWGKTDPNKPGGSFILQAAKVRIIGNCECANRFPFQMTPLKICSKPTTAKQSHCSGDSGGPLMIFQSGRWSLVGISSFVGAAGCDIGDPAGYTRVAPYLAWIRDNTDVQLDM
ncbi:collagenase-like [Amphibalanus amphitrite]|uniref:collagenase-like n=1 Tax=Amphibalanus amphitrite TaxID=1232801 RepID=UPI001C90E340|nr:collagenase-like [Amphibalanus amphitrite]